MLFIISFGPLRIVNIFLELCTKLYIKMHFLNRKRNFYLNRVKQYLQYNLIYFLAIFVRFYRVTNKFLAEIAVCPIFL